MSFLKKRSVEELLAMGDDRLRKLASDFEKVKGYFSTVQGDINEFATALAALRNGKSKLQPVVEKRADDLIIRMEKLRDLLGVTEKDVKDEVDDNNAPRVGVIAIGSDSRGENTRLFITDKKIIVTREMQNRESDVRTFVYHYPGEIVASYDFASRINLKMNHVTLEWNGTHYVVTDVNPQGQTFIHRRTGSPIKLTSKQRHVIAYENEILALGENERLSLRFKKM